MCVNCLIAEVRFLLKEITISTFCICQGYNKTKTTQTSGRFSMSSRSRRATIRPTTATTSSVQDDVSLPYLSWMRVRMWAIFSSENLQKGYIPPSYTDILSSWELMSALWKLLRSKGNRTYYQHRIQVSSDTLQLTSGTPNLFYGLKHQWPSILKRW